MPASHCRRNSRRQLGPDQARIGGELVGQRRVRAVGRHRERLVEAGIGEAVAERTRCVAEDVVAGEGGRRRTARARRPAGGAWVERLAHFPSGDASGSDTPRMARWFHRSRHAHKVAKSCPRGACRATLSGMEILLNGQPCRTRDGATLDDLLHEQGLAERRVAIEVNGEIVPRASAPNTCCARPTRWRSCTPSAAAETSGLARHGAVAAKGRFRTGTHGAIRATGNPAIAGHTGMAGIRGFAAPACAGCALTGAQIAPHAAGRCDDVRGFIATNGPASLHNASPARSGQRPARRWSAGTMRA